MFGEIVEKWGGFKEFPMDMYTDVFHLGKELLQIDGEAGGRFKTNPIIIGHDTAGIHRNILFEDTFADTINKFSQMDWCYVSGCTYFGRHNDADHQSKLCALIFDIDGVTDSTLANFFSGAMKGGAYPIPQHLVLSGHGIHLYYVLDEPLSLYPNIKSQVKNLKYGLTRRMWNPYTSTDKHIQYQGINQGFRVPGSKTKTDAAIHRAQAYRINTHSVSIDELNEFVPEDMRVNVNERYRSSKVSIEVAKKQWPDWYARVIRGEKGQWKAKEDLYEWWKRKIRESASFGHRYFCIMALAIFAAKCGIYDRERVRTDALELMPYLTSLKDDHPFTEHDIDSALECLDGRYVTFPRIDIERITAIAMPANKRNGRKQAVHLMGARAIQKINDDVNGTSWRSGNGRKQKCELVRSYANVHPDKNHSEIARALGISRPTVIKWLRNPDASSASRTVPSARGAVRGV